MVLKKSDKIIAIVGVIILIIAGIGIVYYASNEKETEENAVEEPTIMTYKVMYDEVSYQELSDTKQIRPKLLAPGTASEDFTITAQNLKSIEVTVTYNDKAGFFPLLQKLEIIKKLGADTLTVTLKDSEGTQIDTNGAKGDKKVIMPQTIGQPISTYTIEAESKDEADAILMGMYTDYSQSYTISLSLKTGFIGKIREMLGKHSVQIEVNYIVYDYYLEEVGTGGDDGNPPTDYQPNAPAALGIMVNAGMTRW